MDRRWHFGPNLPAEPPVLRARGTHAQFTLIRTAKAQCHLRLTAWVGSRGAIHLPDWGRRTQSLTRHSRPSLAFSMVG